MFKLFTRKATAPIQDDNGATAFRARLEANPYVAPNNDYCGGRMFCGRSDCGNAIHHRRSDWV